MFTFVIVGFDLDARNQNQDSSKVKITLDDIIDQINERIEKRIKKARRKLELKVSSKQFIQAQEKTFMGENMEVKIPFQDCIEVQFGNDGNIECFKLRKNLTRLAAEKDESNMLEIIKNFEFTISTLNESLFLKEKVDHSTKLVQTDSQKPALLTFVKQLVSEFESYDGNDQDRLEIQEELKNYNEIEMLNCEITKLKNLDDKPMTLKELMFSFFEYAKQKAISISYHK